MIFSAWLCHQSILLLTASVFGYPNDPLYAEQRSYLGAIGMPSAWAEAHRGHVRSRTTIAIIDSGMMSDHPDLLANSVQGYNVADNTRNTTDRTGHGTMVAGVAGAVINNGVGVAGVADIVMLMPISVRGESGQPQPSYFFRALLYVVKQKVDVILLAITSKMSQSLMLQGIEAANDANIPVICGAGNNGRNISLVGNRQYPCEYTKYIDGVICVAGTSEDSMNLYKKSNYAPFVDIAAPADVVTTTRDGGYESVTGTSGSAAIVAGAVAFIKSVSTRTLTVKEIKSIFKETSTPGVKSYNGRTTMTFGRLNVYEALKRVVE